LSALHRFGTTGENIKSKSIAVVPPSTEDDQVSRIVRAALETFSEGSFADAGTNEIARRAGVSKRDIYANFPDKHALLEAVIKTVLQADDENFSNVLSVSSGCETLAERLEIIGLALMNEVLSPGSSFVARLISSETSIRPQIGAIYYEGWYVRRGDSISNVLSSHLSRKKARMRAHEDTHQAARHFIALVIHLPQLSAMVGLGGIWNSKKANDHVKRVVDCFLRAYPSIG
jgi:TetR/AcrR family transcriptional repressor of mexJK operon